MKILRAARLTRFHMKDFASSLEGHTVELASTVWLTSENEDSSQHQGWGEGHGVSCNLADQLCRLMWEL